MGKVGFGVAALALSVLCTAAHAAAPSAACAAQPRGRACAAQTRHRLNARMTRLYRLELRQVMGSYAERRLVHAQNLWRRWANAECLFRVGPADRGGAAWPARDDACLDGLIRQRIAQLTAVLHCSGADCPPK
ncbi:lysozyme inhibitor LprI family protein [Thiomonas sp.]|jgi:hypothetical protein|uniref:lysozyme inhibitor LprI family protein n=1 Tax=Thiomonas sp. TaxID=2047785 RepID=UPI00263A0133|nr:lysozyme inhibitor LprI family protein [Thiomonas sp.]